MANASAMRAMKIVSKAYDAVAEIFRSRDATRLAAEIEAGAGLWQQVCASYSVKALEMLCQ